MAEFQRESKTFSQVLNFTRPDPGTYFDSAGVLQTAAVDEPRFTHDPDTLGAQGLLIEEQRTNLLLWSEAFDDAVWTKTNSNVSADALQAPDSTSTADKLIQSTLNSTHFTAQSFGSAQSGQTYTLTIFAKEGENRYIALGFSGTSSPGADNACFDLRDGVLIGAEANLSETSITPLKDGWFRCSVSLPVSTSGTLTSAIFINQNPVIIDIYTGDGTSGLYIWGSQLEEGAFPTSYIKTEGSQVTRSADNCSRTLGSEFNASEGRIEVTATANVGDTVISLGAESIVADVDTEKTYTLTYNVDPSATTLDIMPGASGTVKSVKYSPRETA